MKTLWLIALIFALCGLLLYAGDTLMVHTNTGVIVGPSVSTNGGFAASNALATTGQLNTASNALRVSINSLTTTVATLTNESANIAFVSGRVDTVYEWSDHAQAGYLSASTNIMDSLTVGNRRNVSTNLCDLTNGVYTGLVTSITFTGIVSLTTGKTYAVGFDKTTAYGTATLWVTDSTNVKTTAGAYSNTFTCWTADTNVFLKLDGDGTSKSDVTNVYLKEITNGSAAAALDFAIGRYLYVGGSRITVADLTAGTYASNLVYSVSNAFTSATGNIWSAIGSLTNGLGTNALNYVGLSNAFNSATGNVWAALLSLTNSVGTNVVNLNTAIGTNVQNLTASIGTNAANYAGFTGTNYLPLAGGNMTGPLSNTTSLAVGTAPHLTDYEAVVRIRHTTMPGISANNEAGDGGVMARAQNSALYGQALGNYAVYGLANADYGVLGWASNAYGGYFVAGTTGLFAKSISGGTAIFVDRGNLNMGTNGIVLGNVTNFTWPSGGSSYGFQNGTATVVETATTNVKYHVAAALALLATGDGSALTGVTASVTSGVNTVRGDNLLLTNAGTAADAVIALTGEGSNRVNHGETAFGWGSHTNLLVVAWHKDGTRTYYAAGADTDAARGIVLTNAATLAVNGDVLILAPAAFNLPADAFLDLTIAGTGSWSLRGSGRDQTIIRSANAITMIRPATNSEVCDVQLVTSGGGSGGWGWGGTGNTPIAATNAALRRVNIYSERDCLKFNTPGAGAIYAILEDVTATSTFECVQINTSAGQGGHLVVRDSSFTCVLDALGTGLVEGWYSAGISAELWNTKVRATEGATDNIGIWADGAVTLHGCDIYSSGTGSVNLQTSGGGVITVDAGTIWTNSSGTIQYLGPMGTIIPGTSITVSQTSSGTVVNSTATGGGDNMGNMTATATLLMAGYGVTNAAWIDWTNSASLPTPAAFHKLEVLKNGTNYLLWNDGATVHTSIWRLTP
mgnify:CR=1 FL=1